MIAIRSPEPSCILVYNYLLSQLLIGFAKGILSFMFIRCKANPSLSHPHGHSRLAKHHVTDVSGITQMLPFVLCGWLHLRLQRRIRFAMYFKDFLTMLAFVVLESARLSST